MELLRFDDEQARAQALAAQIKTDIAKLLRQQEMVTLAVSAGTSPKPLFAALAQQTLDWSRVIIMLTAERVVPNSDLNSNTAFMQHSLKQQQAAKAVFWSYLDEDAIYDEDALQQYANKRFAQPDITVLSNDEADSEWLAADLKTDENIEDSAATVQESPQLDTLLTAPAGIVLYEDNSSSKSLGLTLSAILASQIIYVDIGKAALDQLTATSEQDLPPHWPISYVLNQSGVPVHVYCA